MRLATWLDQSSGNGSPMGTGWGGLGSSCGAWICALVTRNMRRGSTICNVVGQCSLVSDQSGIDNQQPVACICASCCITFHVKHWMCVDMTPSGAMHALAQNSVSVVCRPPLTSHRSRMSDSHGIASAAANTAVSLITDHRMSMAPPRLHDKRPLEPLPAPDNRQFWGSRRRWELFLVETPWYIDLPERPPRLIAGSSQGPPTYPGGLREHRPPAGSPPKLLALDCRVSA
jgi:hypothetical protein